MKTAIVLGTFDGLHAGHRAVIENTRNFYSVAVTFIIPPKSVISGQPQLLILPQDREKRLTELGVNRVVMQNFDDVKDINAYDYLNFLNENYKPSRMVCGFNFRFGKNAEGDTTLIDVFCKENNIEFVCVPPIKKDEEVLSSTYLRKLIGDGNLQEAASQIFGGFSFAAPVIHGDARGRVLGFPTANQEYPNELVKPKFGVYLSQVQIQGKWYKSITNIGVRPTFKTDTIACETFIKDFSGDIYGETITTQLLKFVREEQKFSSEEQLKIAIANDIKLLD